MNTLQKHSIDEIFVSPSQAPEITRHWASSQRRREKRYREKRDERGDMCEKIGEKRHGGVGKYIGHICV
eukprot:1288376-Amorphochlora_amoeboformis.AAC.1